MSNSIIIAWLIGPLYIVVALGMLINRRFYETVMADFLKNEALVYFSGALALVAGVAIVLSHSIWAPDWRVVITVLGWLAIAKGVGRLLFPYNAANWGARVVENRTVMTVVALGALALGLFLTAMALTGA